MSFPLWMPRMRHAALVAFVLLFASYVASAQSSSSQDQSRLSQDRPSAASYSSSQSGTTQVAELAALPEAPAAAASAAASDGSASGQYGNGGGAGGEHHGGLLHNLTFEASGGFNAPESSSVTFGGQFTAGGGVNLNKHLAALVEYQFLDAKLPGALIAETGATGGHAHIWSFTIDPVVDLLPKATNDVYITGGGGFYRKVTSFTSPEPTEYCTYFYCGVGYAPAVVGHFSSNQGGFNVGGGFQHRVGGMYGESHTSIFAEVRYLDVLSPAYSSQPNGLGATTVAAGTKLIPVSFGVRW